MPDPVTAIIGGTIGSGAANIFGAQSAADKVAKATEAANAAADRRLKTGLDSQKSYWDESTGTIKNLASAGEGVYNELIGRLPELTSDIVMDQAALENTPGYQFTRDQGIRGVDLSSVSKGLSGAQAKAAAMFATDLANTTYKDQFGLANTNKTNAFNRLLETSKVGADAGKTLASAGVTAGNAALAGATGTGKIESENLMTSGKANAAADTATGAQVGNMLTGTAGLYANGGNINKNFSMYGSS